MVEAENDRRVSRTMVGPNSANDANAGWPKVGQGFANFYYSLGKHTTYNY
jgi:hypothetical protein